ncbi:MAG: NADH/ubiquinone/plastoquinone (complex I) [Chloroflexi bacterium RBG_16_48_7]|nr:MAG: NADH/ubiquinone/plastoquinone (complex I) [Chloroflexi bacterium RBG_16_48_7]
MTINQLPVIIPVSLLLFTFITFLLGVWRKNLAFPSALTGVTISLLASIFGLITVLQSGPIHYYLGGWAPPLGIEYVLDDLSAFMAVIILSIAFLSMIYSRQSFLKEVPDKIVPLYSLLLLLIAGLSGIVVTGDLFNVYVFLEIASLSAYAVTGIGNDKAPVAVIRYIIIGTIGACFYLLGVGFIYFATGSLNMADVAHLLPGLSESRLIVVAAVFIVIGMALKMALFPFHIWLPDVYTYAPSGVITFVAPLMTKVGAYVVIRMLISVFMPDYLAGTLPIMTVVSWLAAVGIIAGSIMAIAQKDMRRMLAYSSVAQICYVALGIGLANPIGLIGAMLHILNHAVMKGCLFQVAGGIRYSTGLWHIPRFAGLGRRMPWTMGAFAVAAISMVGIPPAAGFFSKWYLVLGSVDAGNWIFVAIILISSLLNAIYFFRILEKVYASPQVDDPAINTAVDPPRSMLAPMMTLAISIIVLGIINAVIVTNILQPIVKAIS